jgi:N-methylhydantoinase A
MATKDGNMRYLIAADTGGTFTDVVVHDRETNRTQFGKTLTNYDDLLTGVLDGLGDTTARLAETAVLKHGTTHVINAFIQRTGAKTALVTTEGFRDLLEIGRGNRAVPFRLDYRRFPPLIPRHLRFGVPERIGPGGEVSIALNIDALRAIAAQLRGEQVQAVAVSFLNAYCNPVHEDAAKAVLTEELPGVFITTGAELSREWSEYERTSTAAANAYVGAQMSEYVRAFDDRLRSQGFTGAFYMMGSNGGVLSLSHTLAQPIALIESGPIGGCIGAAAYAGRLGRDRMIAFDMGGTTAKCALVEEGRFEVQPTYYVGGYEQGFPIRTPVLDIVEVGAGGGSIAWIDDHGRLQLGPRSAGSVPGPIAFGRGGTEPTVTDASVVLGRIGSDSFMNGRLALDVEAARAAIAALAVRLGFPGADGVDRVAQGILDLAAVKMTSAIKEITIERGRDARDFTLFAFGGGGPLFGAELARSLAIRDVIVPPQPGNFSSLGMLLSEARLDVARTYIAPLSQAALTAAAAMFAELEVQATTQMEGEFDTAGIRFEHGAEMRYRGQKHTVRVRLAGCASQDAVVAAFDATYRSRYGHLNEGAAIEFIALRVGALVPTPHPDLAEVSGAAPAGTPVPRTRRAVYFAEPGRRRDTPVYRRADLPCGFAAEGPLIIEEYSATTVVGPSDHVSVGALGELLIVCDPITGVPA